MNHIIKAIISISILSSVISFAQETVPLQLGNAAPGFSLPGVDGKTYTLESFSKFPILVVIFTCNHCPTAQAYEERIIKLADDLKDKGVAIIAISPNDPLAVRPDELGYSEYNDTFNEMKMRAKEKGFNFPYLYDGETQSASKLYGPAATPHVFIFDKNRKLQFSGRIDNSENPANISENDTKNAIEDLIANRQLKVPVTKTFGCSTKWADKRPSVNKFYEETAKEDLTIEPVDETEIRSLVKNGSGKYRLINVWATWCGPCISELPELAFTNWMFRGREFEFISISSDKIENKEKALEILKKKKITGKHLIYNSLDKYKLIEAIDKNWQGALPYTILIAPNGEIIFRKQGEVNPITLRKSIVDKLGRYFF